MSKTTEYVIEKMNEAKDFWNTPFDELIEQGYGAEMIDPTEEEEPKPNGKDDG